MAEVPNAYRNLRVAKEYNLTDIFEQVAPVEAKMERLSGLKEI